MREIGTLPTETAAQRLADYLLTQGTSTRLEQRGDGWAVWVREEERVPAAMQELEQFRAEPEDERYRAAEREANRFRREDAARNAQYRRNMIDARQRWSPATGGMALTWTLIGLSVLVTVSTDFGTVSEGVLPWVTMSNWVGPGVLLPEVRAGQIWRLVTPIFLHLSSMHLLFNMLMMHSLGRVVESRCGSLRMALLVLVMAVVSNMTQYLWAGPGFGGMSGVLFGLFGYVWIRQRYDPRFGTFLSRDQTILMLVWLVVCMLGVIGSIANAAHVGGLITGVVLGAIPVGFARLRR